MRQRRRAGAAEAKGALQAIPNTAKFEEVARVLRDKLGDIEPPLKVATPQGIAWFNESTGELMSESGKRKL